MSARNSSKSAYSFSVPLPTDENSRSENGYDSWLEQSSRSMELASSLRTRRSLYDVDHMVLVTSRADNQKIVTFYRESDSEKPELRIIIDARKYTNLDMLIDELNKILDLRSHERRIYSQTGKLLRRLEDFEDGGSYFFSFSTNDKRFIQALSVADNSNPLTPGEKARNNWKKILNRKKRLINVITNEDSANPWKVLIDETKLQSFSQLLHELNLIIQPRDGRVFRLCTNKGRRVRGLGELFLGTDTFVAIVSSIGMTDNSNVNGDSCNEMKVISPRKTRIRKPTKYDVITGKDSHLERRLVNVKGSCHVFHPPSHVTNGELESQLSTKPPEAKLQIDWIYGYNGQESRDNLFVLKSEEIIYYLATVVVIYDVYRHKQRHYTEHTMKITCMALHPNNWYVATGQSAPENFNIEVVDHIRIWNAESLNTLAVLTLEEQTLSVTRLAFSLEDFGRKIASIDTDGHNHRLLVWQWNSKDIVAKSQSYEEEELSVKFYPHSNKSLLSIGKNHVFYWSWRGSILEKYKGHFFDCDIPKYVNCMSFASSGEAITGDSNGNLLFWKEGSRKIKKIARNIHMGGTEAMLLLSHDVLVTYGKGDNLLSIWETREMTRDPIATIKITGDYGTVTSIAVSPNHHDYNIGDMEFFLGTNKNQILHGTFKTQFVPIVKGHDNETTCLAVNPCYNHILTVGLDGHVIYRSIDEKSIIWEKKIEFPATSSAFFPYGNVLAVGMSTGRWCVLGAEDGSHIASFQSGKNPLTSMTYSIEGGDIAIGTSTGQVYLYSVYDEGHSYRLVSVAECNSEAITTIDWSKDGKYLRTMTIDWDHNILNTEELSEVGDLQLIADLKWQTQKTTLSYATSGIWRPESDLRFLSADSCISRNLLCVGSEFGHVRLYHYPCWNKKANYREYSLHVGRVGKVCFLPTAIHMVSSGQHDNALIQWRIIFGKGRGTELKTGHLREYTVEDHPEGWQTRERSSNLGHRKVRRADSSTRSFNGEDPFVRPSSVEVKHTGVENIPDDYFSKKERIVSPQEIQDYLYRSGTGISERDVVLRKSHDFLHNYDVIGPVTKEQKSQRNRRKSPQAFQNGI